MLHTTRCLVLQAIMLPCVWWPLVQWSKIKVSVMYVNYWNFIFFIARWWSPDIRISLFKNSKRLFFNHSIFKGFRRCILETVYVGQSKESLSTVEACHSVNSVCSMFGSFVKFVVTVELFECGLQSKWVRLESQPSNGLPAFLKEKTRKDRLYNEIVKFVATNNVGWYDPQYGKPFISDLCNVLWYVDGHHEVLASRSCPLPSLVICWV